MPVNWVYGARPLENKDLMDEQILLAHRCRNDLCRHEHDRRAEHRKMLEELAPDFVAASDAVEAETKVLTDARDAIQAERIKQRSKKPVECEAHQEAAKKAKENLKGLRAEMKAAKEAAYKLASVRNAVKKIEEKSAKGKKAILEASGLFWPSQGVLVRNCSSFQSGAPPRFKRWDREGRVAVQLIGGLSVDEALECRHGFLRIRAPEPGEKWGVASVRVGSDGRAPIFASVRLRMHRPLPEGGRIKWAYIERRMLADKEKWFLRLEIDVPEKEPELPEDRWVALHTGWLAQKGDDLKVAKWLGHDGAKGELSLPLKHVEDALHLDDVRAERDNMFNDAKKAMGEFWKEVKSKGNVPEILREQFKTLHSWRSQNRLAGLAILWRTTRFDGDRDGFNAIEIWRKADKMKWQHSSRLSIRISRRRKNEYRKFAKVLGDRYGTIYVCPHPVKKLTRNSQPEELERDAAILHRHSRLAAIFSLHSMVAEKFPLRYLEVLSPWLTLACSECGETNERPSKGRVIACACGAVLDFDDNALANTAARGEALRKAGGLLELARAKELSKAKQQEKLKTMQEAMRKKRAATKAEAENE